MATKRSSPSSSAGSQPDQKRTRPNRGAGARASAIISQTTRAESSLERNLAKSAEELLRDTLAPLKEEEKDEWKAWVEIESDPAFFNGLLRDLGAEDIKVTEVFSVDEVDYLPQPVLGFVLLCKYAGEKEDDAQDVPNSLWFANQTMANGCATVALLNILMNSPDVQLGEKLSEFKRTTRDLPSLLRGYRLESDACMRVIHNAYARRLELLNADLLLSNEFDECKGVPKAEELPKSRGKRKTKSQKRLSPKKKTDVVCHYKAFVPLDGKVWVLDGLEWNPVCLGEAAADAWIPLAIQELVNKLSVAANLSASILAVCQSPTAALRKGLVANIKTLSAARAAIPKATRPAPADDRFYLENFDEVQMRHYGISWAMLDETGPDDDRLAAAGDPSKLELVRQLETEQGRIQSEYRQEVGLVEEGERRCTGRKKNYMPLANKWVEKLAQLGVLEGLLNESK